LSALDAQKPNQPLRILHSWEWPQQDAVDQAENRRIRTDAYRQQNYGCNRNTWLSGQNTESEAKILTHQNTPPL